MKHEPNIDDPLALLTRFADAFALPAAAHAREELTPEQEEALRKLAAGELDAKQRARLVPLLARNECALEFLARLAR